MDVKTKPGSAEAAPALARRRRPRRSAGEIRACLIDAAIEEFSSKGYAGARTAAIAQRAGVVEPLLFKYFGSKANLFQIAIFETLDRHYTAFAEDDAVHPENAAEWSAMTSAYIAQQLEFLRQHSRMFMSLVMRETFEGAETDGADNLSGLQAFLDKMSGFAAARLNDRAGADPKLVARISFGSLLACALFRDWLFPAGMAPEKDITSAVIDFMIKGADIYPEDQAG